jgi:hypothetical protein
LYRCEPQFPDLPAEVAGAQLAGIFGVLGQQADEEVDRLKSILSRCLSPN